MTTTETPFIAATRRGQEAFLQVWKDAMYRFYGVLPDPDTKIANAKAPNAPTAEEVVDHAFDYADAVLEIQRAYVKSMLAANKSINSLSAWMSYDKGAGTAAKKS